MDKRIEQLAHNLVTFSTNVQKGEKVLINAGGIEDTRDLVKALVREVYKAGGFPYLKLNGSKQRTIRIPK